MVRASRVARGVAALVWVGACASGGATPSPTNGTIQQSVTMTSGGGGTGTITMTRDAESHLLTSSPDRVWAALPAVFDSLGIPATTVDKTNRVVGNSAFKVHGRLKGVPLSRYIDCGTSTQIGPNADSYDVVLSLVAQARPGEAGTTSLSIGLEAAGRPATFSQDYSRCPSKGALETRLVETLQRLLRP